MNTNESITSKEFKAEFNESKKRIKIAKKYFDYEPLNTNESITPKEFKAEFNESKKRIKIAKKYFDYEPLNTNESITSKERFKRECFLPIFYIKLVII